MIVEAVIAVAARDGLAATSVRAVGREAGMSAGALRHWFSDQEQLMVFALRELAAIVRRELATVDGQSDPRAAARAALALLVPVEPAGRAAARIWFEVAALAPHRPALQEVWDETVRDIRSVCERVVGLVAPSLAAADRQAAVDDLHLLVDGLALHACYRADVDRAWTDAALDRALARVSEDAQQALHDGDDAADPGQDEGEGPGLLRAYAR